EIASAKRSWSLPGKASLSIVVMCTARARSRLYMHRVAIEAINHHRLLDPVETTYDHSRRYPRRFKFCARLSAAENSVRSTHVFSAMCLTQSSSSKRADSMK